MKLVAKGISRQFYRKREDSNVFFPVKETDLTLEPGKLVVLLGASGSGKSTLLHMLAGILEPTTGEVIYEDASAEQSVSLYQLPDKDLSSFRNAHIGVIPQGQAMIGSLNVLENVLLPFTMYQGENGEAYEGAKEKALGLLQRMGMDSLAEIMPSELSGGEIRRVAIARALLLDPQVILADEPTSDLDEDNTKEVLTVLKEVAASGKIVLVVTHDKEVLTYADVTYRMKEGLLQEEN